MSYISLYRKWRPRVFEDVVEQEHVVRTLRNSVISDRIAHAYLFCGTRGTGKTTMAHIFSRAINCLTPINGDPCNCCEICTGILNGSILDVIEIDAASNNSVDNVREIRDEVIYAPSQAKYKVYIIDEVHMLSPGAFNALLKTLEEPPPHVVFILATTEPHRLPATILSRCQRFDFRRITSDSIISRLNDIATANGITLDAAAAGLIARMSDGALRDAISLLDQCMAMGGNSLGYNDVLEVAGIVNDTFMADMIDSIIARDVVSLLWAVNRLTAEGKDAAKFLGDMILYFRNMLICRVSASPGNLIELPADAVERMRTQAAGFDQNLLISIIKDLSAGEANLKWAAHPVILLEAMLIKLCEGSTGSDKEDITARLARLEHLVSSGSFISASAQAGEPDAAGAGGTASEKAAYGVNGADGGNGGRGNGGNGSDGGKGNGSDGGGNGHSAGGSRSGEPALNGRDAVSRNLQGSELHEWKAVIDDIKSGGRMAIYPNLIGTKAVMLDDNVLGLIFSTGSNFCRIFVSKTENLEVVEAAASKRLGRAVRIKCLDENDTGNKQEDTKTEPKDEILERLRSIEKEHNIPVEIKDE